MADQLPGAGQAFLDHLAHFVPEIDAAAAALERLGFRLTPFTLQTNTVDGAAVPSGTGNRCAMLRRGYLELLAAVSASPLAQQLTRGFEHHVGVHLAAFSTADAAAEHGRLAASGFPIVPLVHMHRPVATPTGSADARFTIARIAPGTMPEGRTQFLTHHTPDLVWRDGDLDHPNGAQGLSAIWIAAADPGEAAQRYALFTGRPARHGDAAWTVGLDRGAVRIDTPDRLAATFGIMPGPTPPYFCAYEIEVADLAALRRCLDAAGYAHRDAADRVVATAPPALGGTILFHAADRT
jgi:hypothetical protein